MGNANASESGARAARSQLGVQRHGSQYKVTGPPDKGKYAKNKYLAQPSYKSKMGDGESSVQY